MLNARLALILTLAFSLVALGAAPAGAAKRKVPFGFFGSVISPEFFSPSLVPDAALRQQFGLMARSGVESGRITEDWERLQPAPGIYNFNRTDRVVAGAARARIRAILGVTSTPKWISSRPNSPDYFRFPPRSTAPYAELMRRLVRRYGPRGRFWAENPRLPKVPIREWQIWNEQNAPWHWDRPRFAPSYTRLLKAAYRAIHRADRRSKVIAGSVVGAGANTPWGSVAAMYRAGAKRFFDVIAVHPFTIDTRSVRNTTTQTLTVVERVRKEMNRRGDRRKPIILTEVTFPGSVGKIPRRALLQLETTPRGQRLRLKSAFERLARERRRLNVRQVLWYTWSTPYNPIGAETVMTFRYSGLTKLDSGAFTSMPVLGTFSGLARKYQGCRKSANARRCR